MDLGNKIKALRLKAGLTQERLAEELNVSFQTISKWENNVCSPDIMMLPRLSVFFGVTIDELFDLSAEQRLRRIEKMLDMESEIPYNVFEDTVEFLRGQLETTKNKGRIYDFLAHIYYHRMISDSTYVENYVKKTLEFRPDTKDCQWLLQKACGAAKRDFNVKSHYKIIDFYKDLVEKNPEQQENYLHLLDNLIDDNRTTEAAEILEAYKKLKGHSEVRALIFAADIAYAEHDDEKVWKLCEGLASSYPEDELALFELANIYARQCEYNKAIEYYEKSFELAKKPRYIDALEGMEICYNIMKEYENAVKCCDRQIQILKEDFGFEEGEPIVRIQQRKQALMENFRV